MYDVFLSYQFNFLISKDPRECCRSIPQLIDQMIYVTCVQRFGDNTQRQLQELQPNSFPKGNCIAECAANASSLRHVTGGIDRMNLTRLYMNAVSGDRVWGDIMSKAIDICFDECKSKKLFLQNILKKNEIPLQLLRNPMNSVQVPH